MTKKKLQNKLKKKTSKNYFEHVQTKNPNPKQIKKISMTNAKKDINFVFQQSRCPETRQIIQKTIPYKKSTIPSKT